MALSNTRDAMTRQRPMMLVALAMLVVGVLDLPRQYDTHLRPRPWLDPVIEILPRASGKPVIRYGAGAQIEARGVWTTWLEVDGVRCCTTKGTGNYIPGRDPRIWHWEEWFGRDWPVPPQPYAACVAYDVTANSGAQAQFGPFCSAEVDPRGL